MCATLDRVGVRAAAGCDDSRAAGPNVAVRTRRETQLRAPRTHIARLVCACTLQPATGACWVPLARRPAREAEGTSPTRAERIQGLTL
jgi:hypothetical protein